MRGRKPIPTRIGEANGKPRRRPNKDEPRPTPGLPEPPPHLSEAARLEWARSASELYALGVITHLDRAALATYCAAYALWAEALEAINQFGIMIKSPTGLPMQSPYMAVVNRQAEIMMKAAAELGLTPSSRSRVVKLTDEARAELPQGKKEAAGLAATAAATGAYATPRPPRGETLQ